MRNKDGEINIRARERYEKEKRLSKPISFNREKDAEIIKITEAFTFGAWVKNILANFSAVEVSFAKDDVNFVPSALVEHSIEKGYFDLDEYLASKGKKIVDQHSAHEAPGYQDLDNINQEYFN